MSLIVRVGEVVFHGQENVAGSGFYVEQGGFSGWEEGTAPRLTEIFRPQAHGMFDLPVFQGARVVTISGVAVAESSAALAHMAAQITGLLADGSSERVFVHENGLDTWASARLGARTKFSPIFGAGKYANYELTLWCPNPRKFGEVREFASGEAAYHYGNFTAAPVMTVAGTIGTGYTIAGPDSKLFTVTQPVVSGTPHTIDMATGHLTVDGAIVHGEITQGDTWGIPGGSTVTNTLTPVSGSGTLTVAVTDTYI